MNFLSFLLTFGIVFGTFQVIEKVTDNLGLQLLAVVAVAAYGLAQRMIGFDEGQHPEKY